MAMLLVERRVTRIDKGRTPGAVLGVSSPTDDGCSTGMAILTVAPLKILSTHFMRKK